MKLLLSRAGAEQKRKTCQGISWDRKSVKRELSGIWGEKKQQNKTTKESVDQPSKREKSLENGSEGNGQSVPAQIPA